jgi:putative cardiolipin synthase
MQKHVTIGSDEVRRIYSELHAYADSPENYSPGVRATLDSMHEAFPRLTAEVIWGKAQFISDRPGKNDRRLSLGGGGLATDALAALVAGARHEIVIQSPYLVLSDAARKLFRQALARGVRVRISTNSLASTDNLQAFSGYRNQRRRLLAMGMEIFEYKPDPAIQLQLMPRAPDGAGSPPVFALHAKTMVVDSEIAYIGTFNLDPRSENLNTEAGVIFRHRKLARAVQSAIETDMLPANSWNAAHDRPDQYATFGKRSTARFWQIMPIKPLL